MPTTKRSGDMEGRIKCQFAGCNRSFSRYEHLQRHALNHADSDYTCTRCHAHFKRADLLDRHMARHRQKDAEGSELMTRKRAWKDSEGRIVTKRPNLDYGNDTVVNATSQTTTAALPSLPPSPPGSASSPLAVSPNAAYDPSYTHFDVVPNSGPGTSTVQSTTIEGSGGEELFWESVPLLSDPGYSTGPFDDIFMPDTASSFNMPYTTIGNYSWLFDLQTDSVPGSDLSLQNDTTLSSVTSAAMHQPRAHQERFERINTGTSGPQSNYSRVPRDQSFCEPSIACHHYRSPQGPAYEVPMGLLAPDRQLPTIDHLTRERMLDVIESCRPILPDGSLISIDHQLLSLPSLQRYLDLFFTRFNTVYHLVHLPTFNATQTEPILLLSAVLLGATYFDKEAHQLAVCIHDVIRPYIFSCPGFSAQSELWVLQAILLTEVLGKSRGGQRQHDMSHLFHGLLINLIRRSECQTASPESVVKEATPSDLNAQWRIWADLESKKRLAQLCFVWDVQHAVLFSQSLCMSAFELRTALPCDQAVWEAATPKDWKAAWSSQMHPIPSLLSVLKSYLSSHGDVPRPNMNAISWVVVLHGLMSFSWDMERRDQTSLGLLSNGIVSDSWRERMLRAYELWKCDFDRYTLDMAAHPSSIPDRGTPSEVAKSLAKYKTTGLAIYHAASLALLTDIIDLQVYGGARHILGRPVSRIDYSRSQKVVKRWANDDVQRATKATWHAAWLLKDASNAQWCSFTAVDVFHHPWTVFLASLTLWAFHQARPACNSEQDDDMIWETSEHMNQLLDGLATPYPHDMQLTASQFGKNCTAGLLTIVASHLSKVRWAVIHDGMLVLKGLIPWRLIYEDDGRK